MSACRRSASQRRESTLYTYYDLPTNRPPMRKKKAPKAALVFPARMAHERNGGGQGRQGEEALTWNHSREFTEIAVPLTLTAMILPSCRWTPPPFASCSPPQSTAFPFPGGGLGCI